MTDPSDKPTDQIELSAKQIEHRLEIGDNLEAAREVHHDGVFPNVEAASQAGEELAALGYSEKSSKKMTTSSWKPKRWPS
jgi:hypothetical protein